MRRFLFFLVLVFPAFTLSADDQRPEGPRGEAMAMFEEYESKLLQLLGAVSEEQLAWRPGDGVRSFAEVFAHVADANVGLPGLLGVAPPEGWSRENRYEGRMESAAELELAVAGSFAHLYEAIAAMPDETLGDEVPWFGESRITPRAALFFMVKHIGEHEGQLVAYARVNGIVPPWSR